MSVESTPHARRVGTPLASRLASWTAVARNNENFQVGGAVITTLATIAMAILHSAAYAANVHNPAAFGGALVGLAASVLAGTVTGASFTTWPAGRWRALAAGTGLLALGFAVLPPITAGYGWLTMLLFALTTLGYEAAAAAWLLIARPWSWMQGAPQ